MQIAEAFCQSVGGKGVNFNDNVAKVSIVGAGMLSNPGVAATMFEALGENNINISMISTSEIKISVLIEKEQGKKDSQRYPRCLRTLIAAFRYQKTSVKNSPRFFFILMLF